VHYALLDVIFYLDFSPFFIFLLFSCWGFFFHLFIYNLLHKLIVIMTHYWLLSGKIMMRKLLSYMLLLMNIIATLILGSRPRQRLVRVWAKKEAYESHLMFMGMQKSVRKWTLTLPSELSFWELESQWILESSKGNYKGQNPLD
jgi:hypothetical protein